MLIGPKAVSPDSTARGNSINNEPTSSCDEPSSSRPASPALAKEPLANPHLRERDPRETKLTSIHQNPQPKLEPPAEHGPRRSTLEMRIEPDESAMMAAARMLKEPSTERLLRGIMPEELAMWLHWQCPPGDGTAVRTTTVNRSDLMLLKRQVLEGRARVLSEGATFTVDTSLTRDELLASLLADPRIATLLEPFENPAEAREFLELFIDTHLTELNRLHQGDSNPAPLRTSLSLVSLQTAVAEFAQFSDVYGRFFADDSQANTASTDGSAPTRRTSRRPPRESFVAFLRHPGERTIDALRREIRANPILREEVAEYGGLQAYSEMVDAMRLRHSNIATRQPDRNESGQAEVLYAPTPKRSGLRSLLRSFVRALARGDSSFLLPDGSSLGDLLDAHGAGAFLETSATGQSSDQTYNRRDDSGLAAMARKLLLEKEQADNAGRWLLEQVNQMNREQLLNALNQAVLQEQDENRRNTISSLRNLLQAREIRTSTDGKEQSPPFHPRPLGI